MQEPVSRRSAFVVAIAAALGSTAALAAMTTEAEAKKGGWGGGGWKGGRGRGWAMGRGRVSVVPQVAQKPRETPGEEANSASRPRSTVKPAISTVSQATLSAPAARRQEWQWQMPTDSGARASA